MNIILPQLFWWGWLVVGRGICHLVMGGGAPISSGSLGGGGGGLKGGGFAMRWEGLRGEYA